MAEEGMNESAGRGADPRRGTKESVGRVADPRGEMKGSVARVADPRRGIKESAGRVADPRGRMKRTVGRVADPPQICGRAQRLKLACLCLTAMCAAALSVYASAQTQRPIRVLVVSPPAGPSDVQARLLVPRMSEALGQTIVVDNRPSNNGVVASELCAKAAPDGYTVCVGNSGTHA